MDNFWNTKKFCVLPHIVWRDSYNKQWFFYLNKFNSLAYIGNKDWVTCKTRIEMLLITQMDVNLLKYIQCFENIIKIT
jgi:hypothetical protein